MPKAKIKDASGRRTIMAVEPNLESGTVHFLLTPYYISCSPPDAIAFAEAIIQAAQSLDAHANVNAPARVRINRSDWGL